MKRVQRSIFMQSTERIKKHFYAKHKHSSSVWQIIMRKQQISSGENKRIGYEGRGKRWDKEEGKKRKINKIRTEYETSCGMHYLNHTGKENKNYPGILQSVLKSKLMAYGRPWLVLHFVIHIRVLLYYVFLFIYFIYSETTVSSTVQCRALCNVYISIFQ